jgi:hypothetical protein
MLISRESEHATNILFSYRKWVYVKYYTATKIQLVYSFSGNSAASAPISTFMPLHVSVSDFYSPRIGLHISSSRIGRPMVGIYKSHRRMNVETGTETFLENICFEISIFCLCSADQNSVVEPGAEIKMPSGAEPKLHRLDEIL